ncbi:MAG: hypothetical protein HYR84_03835 [Planctomycetes bacterium]|nr:hypothetical protein [Planctomycetota bacterium]
MVPASITNNLASLRWRERILAFVWGGACWLAITLVLLAICAFVDWFIDRSRDTPFGVRLGMFFVQLTVAGVGAALLLFLPQIRWLPDAFLALWVEEKVRKYDHRLITAVQLNEPGADLGGMSKELVGVVTQEAEKITEHVGNFAQFANHARVGWAALVLTPIVLMLAIPAAIWPSVCFALLARQFLRPYDIPHAVSLVSVSPSHWTNDEEIPLRFRVTGEFSQTDVGTVLIEPEGMPAREEKIRFIRRDDKGAIFGVDIDKSSAKVVYSARMGDGRTKYPSEVEIVERPIVKENDAYLLLPGYCGLKPAAKKDTPIDQRRYAVKQPQGEVQGILGSSVRVQARVQADVEVHQAWLEIVVADLQLGPYVFDNIVDKKEMKISSDRRSVEARFDLALWQEAYRVTVEDQYKFANKSPPTRDVRLVPEEAPSVTLLRDSFSDLSAVADYDLDPPVVLGGRIRIPFYCAHPYGLGRADILYRQKEKHDSEKEPGPEPDFTRVPLGEEPADATGSPFDPKTGVFLNTPFDKLVAFHAVPSTDSARLGGTIGGGRYFLETKVTYKRDDLGQIVKDKAGKPIVEVYHLKDFKGKGIELKPGDQIEYCVQVFAANHPESPRPPGLTVPVTRSDTRIATVVRYDEFEAFLRTVHEEGKRIERLEQEQTGVFAPK